MKENRSVLDLLRAELHVPRRAARQALRHPERVRHAVQTRDAACRQRARRAARAGQYSHRDVVREPHVAGASRKVGAREHHRDAAAGAAARRASAEGDQERGSRADHARAHGAASERTRVFVVPHADGSDRPRRSRTSTRSAAGGPRARTGHRSMPRADCRAATPSTGSSASSRRCSKRPDRFVGTVTEKLLTYALGRGVEPYDGPAVRAILRDSQSDDYRFSTLVLNIVKSTPFQLRRSQ